MDFSYAIFSIQGHSGLVATAKELKIEKIDATVKILLVDFKYCGNMCYLLISYSNFRIRTGSNSRSIINAAKSVTLTNNPMVMLGW